MITSALKAVKDLTLATDVQLVRTLGPGKFEILATGAQDNGLQGFTRFIVTAKDSTIIEIVLA